MGEVIDILAKQPHQQGRCRCMSCKHEWQGVVPLGADVTGFECPNCGNHKGCFMHVTLPELVWQCNCGSCGFAISGVTNNIICLNCGKVQEF